MNLINGIGENNSLSDPTNFPLKIRWKIIARHMIINVLWLYLALTLPLARHTSFVVVASAYNIVLRFLYISLPDLNDTFFTNSQSITHIIIQFDVAMQARTQAKRASERKREKTNN